jgi:hypothetical protein
VYINKDMTRAERMAEKELRDERNKRNGELTEQDTNGRPRGTFNGKKFYWGVRFGELRKIFDKPTPV